jgi:hypothetical protein
MKEIYKYFVEAPEPSEVKIEADGVKIKLLKKGFITVIEQAEMQEVVYTDSALNSQLETWRTIAEIAELENVEEDIIEQWLNAPKGNKKLSLKYSDKLFALLKNERKDQSLLEIAVFLKYRWVGKTAPNLEELQQFPINLISKITSFLAEERGKQRTPQSEKE